MIKNDSLTITWNPENTEITIANTTDSLVISSNDSVVYCEGGIITANVTEQIYQDMYYMHIRDYFDTHVNGAILKLWTV